MGEIDAEKTQVTELLVAWNNGEEAALAQLLPIVEIELRRIAHNYMRRERGNHTLQTSALVNEAYVKLIDQRDVRWQNRSHFFALSAQIMRRILLNHARDRIAEKRGGGAEHIEFEGAVILTKEKSAELIALDEALEKLAEFDKTKSRIVELRYFGGLTIEETAEALGIAPITVSVNWRLAKAWLERELRGQESKI
ncbi:MAG: sigma-70 family RNA polymerase sigma factor [Acidobacteriota bacterium]|nr:sigma-70 family RNA polymerase sigma factor [Acidobacteriota bacterium]